MKEALLCGSALVLLAFASCTVSDSPYALDKSQVGSDDSKNSASVGNSFYYVGVD